MGDVLPWQACPRRPAAASTSRTEASPILDRRVDASALRQTLPRPSQVNACLLPVVVGVGLASAAELNFTWDCFAYAMGSNLAFSLRGVLTKKSSSSPKVRARREGAWAPFPREPQRQQWERSRGLTPPSAPSPRSSPPPQAARCLRC